MRNLLAGLAASVLALGVAGPGLAQTSKTFIADGAPVVAEQARKGEAMLSVPVRHGLTGRLTAPVESRTLTGSQIPIPVGQPMFGLVMGQARAFGKPADIQIVWCTLRFSPFAKTRPDRWASICLPKSGRVHVWLESPILAPSSLTLGNSRSPASEPKVEPGPAAFDPPLMLSYRFVEFGGKEAVIDIYLKIGKQEEQLRRIKLELDPDGSALLHVMQGQLRLRSVPGDRKAVRVEIAEPLQPGSSNLPIS